MPPTRDPFQDPEIARARKRRALLLMQSALRDRPAPQPEYTSGVPRIKPLMKVRPTRRTSS